jgi:hypothetical protein
MFFDTRDFQTDYAWLVEHGVRFVRAPSKERYGTFQSTPAMMQSEAMLTAIDR